MFVPNLSSPASHGRGAAPASYQLCDPHTTPVEGEYSVALDKGPATPVVKPSTLSNLYLCIRQTSAQGQILTTVFTDKKLPGANTFPLEQQWFDLNYFKTLSVRTSAAGPTWSAGTPNCLGARVRLTHTALVLPKWRQHLIGYEDLEICQYLEYGFPIGLCQNPPPVLESAVKNHSSAYQFYPWVDEFLASGIARKYIAGPYKEQPFENIHISPLMTAVETKRTACSF